MFLDRSILNSLLALPCVINNDGKLTNIPLLSKSQNDFGTVYYLEVNPGESLEIYLERIYDSKGPYDMDCTIYAQLAAKILTGTWPIDGGTVSIFIGDGFGGFMLWKTKIPQMGYISLSDKMSNKIISGTDTPSKGEWCIRLCEEIYPYDDKFLGLTSNGPQIFNIDQWVHHLRQGLEEYHKKWVYLSPPTDKDILMRWINVSLMTGKFDEWNFRSTYNGDIDINIKWTSNLINDPPLIFNNNIRIFHTQQEYNKWKLNDSDQRTTSFLTYDNYIPSNGDNYQTLRCYQE